MRWEKKLGPQWGDTRTISRFLLFPKKLGGEWRWLEKSEIVQWHGFLGWIDQEWKEEQ